MKKLLMLLFVTMVGCGTPSIGPSPSIGTVINDNKPLILQTIQKAASAGSRNGLMVWARTNPAGAVETANALIKTIDMEILPYLSGGQLHTSAEVDTFLNSSLYSKLNLPSEVRLAIAASAIILDIYVSVPSSSTLLTVDQTDYLKAFVTGLRDGCNQYISNPKDFSTPTSGSGRWFNPK